MADLLASEYGWTFRDIMQNTYPEDYFLLTKQIKLRHIEDYLTQIEIDNYPRKDEASQKKFIDNLLGQHRFLSGQDKIEDQLDREAVEQFRRQFMGSKNIGVKKVK